LPNAAVAAPGGQRARGASQAPVTLVPFLRASGEHREPAGIDVSRLLTTSDQDLGVFDIPAYGYVRNIVLVVTASGGVGTGVAASEDGPWNVLKNISFAEPNGAQIAAFNTGHDLYLANKWGGYRAPEGADPKASPVFSAPGATTGSFSFLVRIPVELNPRTALGALGNQNAAATFKMRLSLAKAADVYSTVPATTLPTVRIRAYLEAWDQPLGQEGGQANQTTPPAVNTTSFWTSQTFNVSAGQQNIKISRVGNYIRNMIFVLRRNGTSRANGHGDMPDPTTIFLDARPIDTIERNNWLHQMYERTGFGRNGIANDAASGLDNGVFVYDNCHEFDGTLGRELNDGWLPTLGSTRLEISGTFGNAGTLTVMTNDVAIAGNVFS
jgi:hypothetical protein